MKEVNTVITDFDNTLFDWFSYWYASFSTFLEGLEKQSGIDRHELTPFIRKVYQANRTSEYFNLIDEIEILNNKHIGEKPHTIYSDIIAESRRKGLEYLALYPTVKDTLIALKKQGVCIVIYTESQSLYSVFRLKKFGLDGIVDFIYTPDKTYEDLTLTKYNGLYNYYHEKLEHTVHRALPEEDIKPNPKVLTDILASVDGDTTKSIFIGDSRMKDISMAIDAGVTSVFAKYGIKGIDPSHYDLLKEVSHWTDETIKKEALINAGKTVSPSFVLENNFQEILELFSFVSSKK